MWPLRGIATSITSAVFCSLSIINIVWLVFYYPVIFLQWRKGFIATLGLTAHNDESIIMHINNKLPIYSTTIYYSCHFYLFQSVFLAGVAVCDPFSLGFFFFSSPHLSPNHVRTFWITIIVRNELLWWSRKELVYIASRNIITSPDRMYFKCHEWYLKSEIEYISWHDKMFTWTICTNLFDRAASRS